MTRVFTESGAVVPVTVLQIPANRVTQIKVEEADGRVKDGYRAIQVTVGNRRPSRVNKAAAGHFAKASVEPGRGLWEFRLGPDEGAELEVGAELRVDLFNVGDMVDVQGTTIGKGFAGVMKRYGFSGGRKTHGNSLAHRSAGSIGQNQTPGRVFPGKKMAGQMGNVRRSQQNLEVVEVDANKNLILVKGSIPGARGQDVLIRPAVKLAAKKA